MKFKFKIGDIIVSKGNQYYEDEVKETFEVVGTHSVYIIKRLSDKRILNCSIPWIESDFVLYLPVIRNNKLKELGI